MSYVITERWNLKYHHKPLFADTKIATFDKQWKALLYRWWYQFWWEGIIHFERRWDIEEYKGWTA